MDDNRPGPDRRNDFAWENGGTVTVCMISSLSSPGAPEVAAVDENGTLHYKGDGGAYGSVPHRIHPTGSGDVIVTASLSPYWVTEFMLPNG